MIYFIFVMIFVFGLVIGSFINALQYRIQSGKTMKGRSMCPVCEHTLSWYDLFPIISWVSLGGKCRYCKKPISAQYPIVELITGLSFFGVFYSTGLAVQLSDLIVRGSFGPRELFLVILQAISVVIITFAAILVGLHDYKTTYVLSKYVYLGIIAGFIYNLSQYSGLLTTGQLVNYMYSFILAAIIPAGIFYLMYFLSKGRWMGEGEYELALFMGFTLGFPLILPAYYFAFIVGSIVGLALIYLQKTKKFGSEIAFGPYLMGGLLFSLIFGQQIISLYTRVFMGL